MVAIIATVTGWHVGSRHLGEGGGCLHLVDGRAQRPCRKNPTEFCAGSGARQDLGQATPRRTHNTSFGAENFTEAVQFPVLPALTFTDVVA
jgi:hypothetical protein